MNTSTLSLAAPAGKDHQGESTPPQHGPYRLYVEKLPCGVALDVSHHLGLVIGDLVTGHMDTLREIADEPDEERAADLLEALVDQIGPTIPVYGDEAHQLADRIASAAGPRGESSGEAA